MRKIRFDLTSAFDRTQSCIAGERRGGETLCSPRDFDVFCAAPHSISQTTARRSCHVGVLESAAEEKEGCRKSRSQRGSNSITRPIQTPCNNLYCQVSSTTKTASIFMNQGECDRVRENRKLSLCYMKHWRTCHRGVYLGLRISLCGSMKSRRVKIDRLTRTIFLRATPFNFMAAADVYNKNSSETIIN